MKQLNKEHEKVQAAISFGDNLVLDLGITDGTRVPSLLVNDISQSIKNIIKSNIDTMSPSQNYLTKVINKSFNKDTVRVKGVQYAVVGLNRKLKNSSPSDEEIHSFAMSIYSFILNHNVVGFLKVGGYIDLYRQTENDPSVMLFSYPMVKVGEITPTVEV